MKLDPFTLKAKGITSPAALVASSGPIYQSEAGKKYTGADFLRLAKGNAETALALFGLCEWQHPETLIDEDRDESPDDQCFPSLHIGA